MLNVTKICKRSGDFNSEIYPTNLTLNMNVKVTFRHREYFSISPLCRAKVPEISYIAAFPFIIHNPDKDKSIDDLIQERSKELQSHNVWKYYLEDIINEYKTYVKETFGIDINTDDIVFEKEFFTKAGITYTGGYNDIAQLY